ncbi:Zn(2)-C6 fungal-type DNA-binding domain protein [Cordyceps fumosorosea ARSEF 2679]|uniref:Zn(2)-C6 fungal-type DNA-binding domain protein n=1 Tax=Cordyceps fumosorosea (strain ARSEF 2679) TaxID=1081104 RepID=A0A168BRA0_CORFA|nr:Zn(2)-C6 fungal-type DNA-binding domain protein [Cordyceps fumosorosea ARSEF 2679]OAA70446.1 Zn(2)-C6 fungal-type DNA-binding domain protein [Cordyceps fumosorosea ARSEF 2679]
MPTRRGLVGTRGCLTCRIRKVKCDEAKPACLKCRSTGRACDGYTVLPFSRTELLQGSRRRGHGLSPAVAGGCSLAGVMLSDGTFRGTLEWRYIEFFRCCTVASTNLTVASTFWNRIVLQASHAEPAVKHAVLALAAMHGGMLDRDDEYMSRQHMLHATEQYTLALGAARTLVSNSAAGQIHRVLIVCLLFAVWEGVQGNYEASQRHMHAGRALAARFDFEIRRKASLAGIVYELMEVLVRIDISAISFSDDSAPYQPPHRDSTDATAPSIGAFRSIQQANATLMDITRRLLRLGSEMIPGADEAEDRQRAIGTCTLLLERWAVRWEDWYAANGDSSDPLSTLNVQLWYACTQTLVDTGFSGPETRYDMAADRFRDVVAHSEKLSSAVFQNSGAVSFSLDLGYLIPTFFVATRCRDPSIRRRALRVLQSYPRHEGAWQSGPAAAIAERWIAVEERGLEDAREAAQIPEHERVVLMEVQVRKSDGRARLRFQLARADDAHLVEDIVSW